jgi:quinohemoprotein ethanol dehydrogenase
MRTRARSLYALTVLLFALTSCAAPPPSPTPTAAPKPTEAAKPAASPAAAPSPSPSPSPAAVASPAAAVASPAASPSPAAAAAAMPVGDPAGRDWMTYGGNLYNQRYSSLSQISANNVRDLKGAWTYKTGKSSPATSFESSPVVVGGTMYLTGPQSQVYALNAKTGQELWKYEPQMAAIEALPLCCGQVNRGVAVGEGKVFVGQIDAKLVALDQRTGAVAWSVQVDDPRAGYTETMAPLYHNGRVYIGISGAEYEIRGHVTAYEAATGRQIWRFHTIPGPGEFGHETWPQGTDMWRYGGGSMWQTPALDPELGLLYIMVGNPSPDLDGSIREGDNLFTESIVALDLQTGQRRWHFQQIRHDIWDLDTVSPNILFDTQIDGRQVKGLAQAGKTGWVYLLNRENGQPLVPINDRPVPQSAQQKTAAMQPFPDGDPFVPHACPEQVGNYPMGGVFTPFERDPILICPGANGGSEWSVASYSPQTSFTYVCGIHQPQIWTAKPEKLEPGTLRLGSAFVTPPGGRTWGTLTAIDVRTNKIAWQKSGDRDDDFKQMCIGGPMATAGGLLFAGEGNGNFNAYDARTGNRLWQFQTGAGVNAPPVTYEVDGEQFVAVASGGNFQLNFPRGDTLWVFSLRGTMGPVQAPPVPESVQPAAALAINTPKIVDFAFEPAWILVPPGTTVTWTNEGPTIHSATSDAGVWDSGILQQGQTYSFTFNQEGSFDYFCVPHPFQRGKVIVDRNAPPPTTGPAPAGPREAPEQRPAEGQPTATPTTR